MPAGAIPVEAMRRPSADRISDWPLAAATSTRARAPVSMTRPS